MYYTTVHVITIFAVFILFVLSFYSVFLFYHQELCENPQLFVGGASRFDIAQGELGKSTSGANVIVLLRTSCGNLCHEIRPCTHDPQWLNFFILLNLYTTVMMAFGWHPEQTLTNRYTANIGLNSSVGRALEC